MRPASTLLVVGDRDGRIEVLMGKRSDSASFAPGAFVFPGGVVDDSDGGSHAIEASGGDRDPWRVAAIRETYEETGALVAVTGESALVGGSFWDAVQAGNSTLQLDSLAHVSTWVTPAPLPKRYDTRFYLTRSRPLSCSADGDEFTEVRWVVPDEALTAWTRGSFPAISPTVAHLTWLAQFGTAEQAWEGAVAGAFAHLVDQAVVEGVQPAGLGRSL